MHLGGKGCFPNEAAEIHDDCIAKGWTTYETGFPFLGELTCDIPSTFKTGRRLSGDAHSFNGCFIHPDERRPSCVKMYGDPPQFLKKADFLTLTKSDFFIANCSLDGTIPGAIPPGINMNGETECTCDSASGYAGNWPDCLKCSDNHILFGGVCLPDSGDDFGELSDAVLCGAFGGEVLQQSLPQEAQNLLNALNTFGGSSTAAENAKYLAMRGAIQAKWRGDIGAVNTFLSRYDTGGADYIQDVYRSVVFVANTNYGAGTFDTNANNQLAAILARVPVRGPDKCIGANNSDALCVLDDEADSAGVLPCQGQFQRLWTCRNTGWSFSVNNGGSCGVLLTLAGGTTSDQCHLSGSASPLCDDVFGADVDFPAPTLSTDGATLRFVYNCDPDGSKGLIPATTNAIAATECATCPGGRVAVNGECVCPTGAIVIQGVCTCPDGQEFLGNVCIPESGDFGLSDELLCGAFGGTVQTATGGREVCSGMDANDTFCIMDSAVGFPCRGLFKHLRSCNVQFNRKALNPFFCGENCGAQKAVGSECR